MGRGTGEKVNSALLPESTPNNHPCVSLQTRVHCWHRGISQDTNSEFSYLPIITKGPLALLHEEEYYLTQLSTQGVALSQGTFPSQYTG